jgi:hypothetical protein
LAKSEAGGKNGWFMAQELKVIQDFHDFILWIVRHTEKFPRQALP